MLNPAVTYGELVDLQDDPEFIGEFPEFDRTNVEHIIAAIVWIHKQLKGENPKALVVAPGFTFEVLKHADLTGSWMANKMRQLVEAQEREDDEQVNTLMRFFDGPLARGVQVKFHANSGPLHGLTLMLHEECMPEDGAGGPHIYTQ